MLAAEHACTQPEGLSGVIYASAPASIPLWQSEVLRLFKELTTGADAMSDDAIMQAKIYQHPPEQLIAYYKNMFIPRRKNRCIFSGLMRNLPPSPPPTMCYGARMNLR